MRLKNSGNGGCVPGEPIVIEKVTISGTFTATHFLIRAQGEDDCEWQVSNVDFTDTTLVANAGSTPYIFQLEKTPKFAIDTLKLSKWDLTTATDEIFLFVESASSGGEYSIKNSVISCGLSTSSTSALASTFVWLTSWAKLTLQSNQFSNCMLSNSFAMFYLVAGG